MATEFIDYVSVTKFSVSLEDGTSITIQKGAVLQFNGKVAIIDEDETTLPKLRAAVNAGWLVPQGSDTTYLGKSAKISVRGATPQSKDFVSGGTAQVSDEERVVGDVTARRTDSNARRAAADAGAVSVQDPNKNTSSPFKGNIIRQESDQEAVVVSGASFKSAAKQKITVTSGTSDASTYNGEVATPKTTTRVASGVTFVNENIGEGALEGVTREEAARGSNTIDGDYKVVSRVGQPPTAQRQEQASQATTAVTFADIEEDDTLDIETKEGRYRIAKIITPELPDFDFTAHWRHKIQTLEATKSLVFVRAVYASESETLKKRIKETFPEAF